MLIFFTNLYLVRFQDMYLAFFLLFSVIDGFWWFQIGSLHKNVQLILEFFKAPILVLPFSYQTLMTFLMVSSVILLSMLMILFSTLSVIRHLICGNNQNWLLNLNLIYKTVLTGVGRGLLVLILEISFHSLSCQFEAKVLTFVLNHYEPNPINFFVNEFIFRKNEVSVFAR